MERMCTERNRKLLLKNEQNYWTHLIDLCNKIVPEERKCFAIHYEKSLARCFIHRRSERKTSRISWVDANNEHESKITTHTHTHMHTLTHHATMHALLSASLHIPNAQYFQWYNSFATNSLWISNRKLPLFIGYWAHELKFISFYVTKKTTMMTTAKRMVNPFMSLYILSYNMASLFFFFFSSLLWKLVHYFFVFDLYNCTCLLWCFFFNEHEHIYTYWKIAFPFASCFTKL